MVIQDICLFAIIPGTIFFLSSYCSFTIGILSGDSCHTFFCHFAYSYQVIDVLTEIDQLCQPPELRRLLTVNHTISRYVLEMSVCQPHHQPVCPRDICMPGEQFLSHVLECYRVKPISFSDLYYGQDCPYFYSTDLVVEMPISHMMLCWRSITRM